MKKIVKNTAKNSIKKAQNGMSTAAKRAASIASQKKDNKRDYDTTHAAINNSRYTRDDVIYREPFGESPTKIKGSWKDNTTSIYETSNPSKVGLVKKPNVEKRRTAGEKKIMGVLEKGKKADGTMKEGAQRKIASIRAKERAGVQKLENKAARVEKRAAIGEAKANVKAVKKSFNKGTSAKERVAEKSINLPKRGFPDTWKGGSFGFETKLVTGSNGKPKLLGSERAKTPKSKHGTKVFKK